MIIVYLCVEKLGETTGGVSSANVEVNGTLYERIDVSVSGNNSEIDNIVPETKMLIFCCPDNEGIYKIITSTKKRKNYNNKPFRRS